MHFRMNIFRLVHCFIHIVAHAVLEERLICLKSVKISYLAKEKSSSRTAACRGSRQHFWQNDKIVAIRTMGFVILFPTLLWKECVLSYLLKMAKSRSVFVSLLKKSSYILRRSQKYDENLQTFLMLLSNHFFLRFLHILVALSEFMMFTKKSCPPPKKNRPNSTPIM